MDSSEDEDNNFNDEFFDDLHMQITESKNHQLAKAA